MQQRIPRLEFPVNPELAEKFGIQIICDARCEDYDWLVVYDDFPREDVGTIIRETEPLACRRDHTILVTAEPPSIKIYPRCYTDQFGYVLTTHDPLYLSHPNYRRGQGCLLWMAGYGQADVYERCEFPKTKLISTVCSVKQMKRTRHFSRFRLTEYISARLPQMDWYGWGKNPLRCKATALSDYEYHLAVENYIHPYHWSDKIADPLLGLCLTFYAGDSKLGEILPEESFVPIPLDDPPVALDIMQRVMRDGEYSKRLPAIREARRLILTKYNIFNRIGETICQHNDSSASVPEGGALYGRHRLRCNPFNALQEFAALVRFRCIHPVH